MKVRLKAEKLEWDFQNCSAGSRAHAEVMHIYHEFTVSRISASPWGKSLVLVQHQRLKGIFKLPSEVCGLQNLVESAWFLFRL